MAILNRTRQQRVESDNLSQAQLARQIEVSRQTLNAIERAQRLPSLEVAHRIADALECSLDDVFRYESEFPSMGDDDDDQVMTVIVRLDDDPEWWTSEDVCRVTTSAKRCSDAARKPHSRAVCRYETSSARRVIRYLLSPAAPTGAGKMLCQASTC